jgi:hypothetical protein
MKRNHRRHGFAGPAGIAAAMLLAALVLASAAGAARTKAQPPPTLGAHRLAESELEVTIRGGGRVVSSPAGIDCPGTCSAHFPDNTKVTLTAKPASGYTFDQWSGPCTGSDPTCPVFVTPAGKVSVIAIFAKGTGTAAGCKCEKVSSSGVSAAAVARASGGTWNLRFRINWSMACSAGGSASGCKGRVRVVPITKGVSVTATKGPVACAGKACGGTTKGSFSARARLAHKFNAVKFRIATACTGKAGSTKVITFRFRKNGSLDLKKSVLR